MSNKNNSYGKKKKFIPLQVDIHCTKNVTVKNMPKTKRNVKVKNIERMVGKRKEALKMEDWDSNITNFNMKEQHNISSVTSTSNNKRNRRKSKKSDQDLHSGNLPHNDDTMIITNETNRLETGVISVKDCVKTREKYQIIEKCVDTVSDIPKQVIKKSDLLKGTYSLEENSREEQNINNLKVSVEVTTRNQEEISHKDVVDDILLPPDNIGDTIRSNLQIKKIRRINKSVDKLCVTNKSVASLKIHKHPVDTSFYTNKLYTTDAAYIKNRNGKDYDKNVNIVINKSPQKNETCKKKNKGEQIITERLYNDSGDRLQDTDKTNNDNISINVNLDTTVLTLKRYCYLFDEESRRFIQDILNFGNLEINAFILERLSRDCTAYGQIMKDVNKNFNTFKNGKTKYVGVDHGSTSTNVNLSTTYGDTSTVALKKYNYLFDEGFANFIEDISFFYGPNVIAFIFERLCTDCMSYERIGRNYNTIENEQTNNGGVNDFLFDEEVQSIIRGILSFGSPYINQYIYNGFYRDCIVHKQINRSHKNKKTNNGAGNCKNISINSATSYENTIIIALKRYNYLFHEEFEKLILDILNFEKQNINEYIHEKLYRDYMAYKQIIRNCVIKNELYRKHQLIEKSSILLHLLSDSHLWMTSTTYFSRRNFASPMGKRPKRNSNFLKDGVQWFCWELRNKILENLVLHTLSQLF